MTTSSTQLINVNELANIANQANVHILDTSWYLPAKQRDCQQEFLDCHIPGAHFFDIDVVSDHSSDLPHMLPSAELFAQTVGGLGIVNQDRVIVYDTAGLFSAARVWWMFKVFGHQDVLVLNGGLPAWQAAGLPVSNELNKPGAVEYKAILSAAMVRDKSDMISNAESGECVVLDARPHARFTGQDPEPRPELSSGHMPNSVSLPFDQLIENGHLKPVEQLKAIFASLDVHQSSQLITSCGSGVTAAIITLALAEAGLGLHSLYDGAWSEWAAADDTVILRD